MSKTILLTGANGKTGRAILQKLAGLKQVVKVFIRDKAQWPELKAMGASGFAVGDMLDVDSIDSAVMGCDKLIHIGPPMHPDEKQIIGYLLNAAKQHAVRHFIYYSVMHPLRRDVRHHSLKLDAEQLLIESGLPYTILQPMRYMQHLLPIWLKVVEEGVHAMPFNTQVNFSVVDLADVAEATAIVTAEEGHQYASYELAGPQGLSQQNMAAIITGVIGKPVVAQAISFEQLAENAKAKGLNEDRVQQMLIMNKHYDDYGFAGNSNVLSWILGRMPTSYQQFVERLWAQTDNKR
ncbi:MAG: hypothetical protein ACJAYG_002213 [Oceanicoccus sp.]|jgi:uncharacterized protein YbjT (DUF2867 family)